jgi:hypothetical protein
LSPVKAGALMMRTRIAGISLYISATPLYAVSAVPYALRVAASNRHSDREPRRSPAFLQATL